MTKILPTSPVVVKQTKQTRYLVGEVYIDVEVGSDCDGEMEVRRVVSASFSINNKHKGLGGSVSVDLQKFSDRSGLTVADTLCHDDLLAIIKKDDQDDEEERQRELAEDRAFQARFEA